MHHTALHRLFASECAIVGNDQRMTSKDQQMTSKLSALQDMTNACSDVDTFHRVLCQACDSPVDALGLCTLHLQQARTLVCFGSEKNGVCCSLEFQDKHVRQPVHAFGMCRACCEDWNDGYCVCPACLPEIQGRLINSGFRCFGTSIFECPVYMETGERAVYATPRLASGGCCADCCAFWAELHPRAKNELDNVDF